MRFTPQRRLVGDEGDRRDECRDGQERQPYAADLIQPSADRRPDYEREARARHHGALHASALGRPVEIGEELHLACAELCRAASQASRRSVPNDHAAGRN